MVVPDLLNWSFTKSRLTLDPDLRSRTIASPLLIADVVRMICRIILIDTENPHNNHVIRR